MRIAMACSEANPFVKTGGLADVTYALSKQLVSLGEKFTSRIYRHHHGGDVLEKRKCEYSFLL